MVLINCSFDVYGLIYVLMLLLFEGGYTMHTIVQSMSLCYLVLNRTQLLKVYHIILRRVKESHTATSDVAYYHNLSTCQQIN